MIDEGGTASFVESTTCTDAKSKFVKDSIIRRIYNYKLTSVLGK